MPTTIAVRFRYNPKIYWFSANGCSVKQGDYVLIERENAQELGLVTEEPFEVDAHQEATLNAPLKPIARVIGEDDYAMLDELDAKSKEAYRLFRELAERHHLDMKPIDVDYLVGGNKAVFYFSSEERVDFRDLVRDLASQLHIHVDMHQIGVRDEARAIGGLGHCGEQLCCSRLGGEFFPVSIRMAKEQDLPLNPAKVSGTCGRLMCCLRYEFEAYKDFKTRAPKNGAIVDTPVGQAKVTGFDTPRELVNLRLTDPDDHQSFTVPFASFQIDPDKDKNDKTGTCPGCSVSLDTLHECCARSLLKELAALEKPQGGFTGSMGGGGSRRPRRSSAKGDKASHASRASGSMSSEKDAEPHSGGSNGGHRRRRRGSGGSSSQTTQAGSGDSSRNAQRASQGGHAQGAGNAAQGNRKNGQNRSKAKGGGQGQGAPGREGRAQGAPGTSGNRQNGHPRPGQNSSGLHNSSHDDTGYGNRRKRRSSTEVPASGEHLHDAANGSSHASGSHGAAGGHASHGSSGGGTSKPNVGKPGGGKTRHDAGNAGGGSSNASGTGV